MLKQVQHDGWGLSVLPINHPLAPRPKSTDTADMAQITSRKELEEWLKDKPVDWAQVIAVRAALRIIPYAFTVSEERKWVNDIALTLFRATEISWAARNIPAHNVTASAAAAAIAATARSNAVAADSSRSMYISGEAAIDAYAAAAAAATAAADACFAAAGAKRAFFAVVEAIKAARFAARSAVYAARPTFSLSDSTSSAAVLAAAAAEEVIWISIRDDYDRLANGDDLSLVSEWLTREPLWLTGEPAGWRKAWISATGRLAVVNQVSSIWIDWYNRRIEGHDAAFDIPGDTDRIEDKKILALLADATEEDFWGKGATYVNTTLQGWINDARERVRLSENPDQLPPPPPEVIRAVAAEIASPSVTLTNNQLDVATNAAFDGQSDTANLDEAIAVLRAVVGALLGGLPGNAPRSFAANLTIYDGELAKRDAKPFLGVLVRMEKSVSAGFHADPEMFDAGVITNFESYFDAHLAFMTHYRRNEEREAKIAQFSIDDAAASGVALTGPVDEVVKEVDALAEQGLVTDGFVQAIKEQQAINYEVALYTSSMPTISGEPSVKKRLILQIVGILERALAVVNNLVSATAQYGAFVKVVKQAIAELLKFFI